MLGENWTGTQPVNPQIGDCFFDTATLQLYMDRAHRVTLSSAESHPEPEILTPTQDELDNHPTLKEAREQYVIIRKLVGL